jgi:membrane protease subunit HflC
MNNNLKSALLMVLFLVLLLAVSSMYVVNQGQHALVLRLGRLVLNTEGTPINVGPGLHFKYPFINTIRLFDTRLQTLDIKSTTRVVTKEKKDVIVDYYVKWRISDLGRYYRSTSGNEFNAQGLLEQVLNTSLRDEFGKRTIHELVSGERDDVMAILQKNAGKNAENLGMEVVDVRIKGIDFPSTISENIYQRMRANMEKIANRHRADGRGEAEAIQAEADKKVVLILAKAKSDGDKIQAKGLAIAAKIYTDAYKQAPDFFAFYRSLLAYRNTFSNKNDVLILNQKGQFFNYFNQSSGHMAAVVPKKVQG